MNKSDIVSSMAEIARSTKVDAERMLDAFIETVENALKSGGEIRLVGFGTFCTSIRKATKGHNPKTGAEINIPERITPKFRPGKQLKDCVAKK